ncbi:MAG: hypothetical protein IJ600_04535 [Lachnospiraceae bacterium]|nr:hypothetical protein [Lachnospiraceae bacterium]
MSNMLEAIQHAFTLAGGTPGLSALFLAGLIALWYGKEGQKNDTRMLFHYALVMLLVIISPPYLYLTGRFFQGYTIDKMYLWLLPLTPVLLKVFSDATGALKKLHHRVLFVLAAAALLLLAGTTSYSAEGWKLTENSSYIPEETLSVLKRLQGIRREKGKEEILVWAPQDIMDYGRRYEGGLLFVYGRDLWLGPIDSEMHQIYDQTAHEAYAAMEDAVAHTKEIGKIAEAYQCDILVVSKERFYEEEQPWPRLYGNYVLREILEENLIYMQREVAK